jgi:hypothetical protein
MFGARGYSQVVVHGWRGQELELQLKRQKQPSAP